MRTPEGVAIWLEVSQHFPHASLPKKVWKHRDPLAKGEVQNLAQVMKDARPKHESGDKPEKQPQGTGAWSQQLHFSWDIVLREIFAEPHPKTESSKRPRFAKFWNTVVAGRAPERSENAN